MVIKQVLSLKRQYPNVILLVEVGYKYRFFGDDAQVSAPTPKRTILTFGIGSVQRTWDR